MPSRMRARLPPTDDWIPIAVTIRSRSSLPTRRTMLARAAGVALPSFISRITRDSSSEIGGVELLGHAPFSWGGDKPAFLPLESRLTVRGGRGLEPLRRRPRRPLTYRAW